MFSSSVVLALSVFTLAAALEERQYCYQPPPSSNSTTSATAPDATSVETITMSFNSSTSTTVITFTSDSPEGTGTGTGVLPSVTGPSGTAPYTSTITVTPPYTNTTGPSSSTSFNSTEPSTSSTLSNSTTIATSTTSSDTAEPTACPGENFDVCDGTCTDLANDTQNCGGCGIVCPSGADNYQCTNGVCTRPPCDSTCGSIRTCGASNSTCICATDVDDNGLCLEGTDSCDDKDLCLDTSDCGFGFVCVPNTCCSVFYGVCLNTRGCLDSLDSGLSRAMQKTPLSSAGNVAGRLHINGAWA